MSLKENVSYIKEEIGQEEKMLEGLIRFEGWFRRYKTLLLSALALLVALWVGLEGYGWYKEHQAQKANALYEQLLQNPTDAALAQELQKSGSELYELFLFHKASQKSDTEALSALQGSKNEIIASLASYQIASLSKDSQKLEAYTQKEGVLFGDLALMGRAYLLMQEGKIEEAKVALDKISVDSPIKGVAKFLEHFTAKGGAR